MFDTQRYLYDEYMETFERIECLKENKLDSFLAKFLSMRILKETDIKKATKAIHEYFLLLNRGNTRIVFDNCEKTVVSLEQLHCKGQIIKEKKDKDTIFGWIYCDDFVVFKKTSNHIDIYQYSKNDYYYCSYLFGSDMVKEAIESGYFKPEQEVHTDFDANELIINYEVNKFLCSSEDKNKVKSKSIDNKGE